MYKYVIFDLDGTLLNTLDDLGNAGNFALKEQGFPTHEIEKYKYFVGNGIPKLIERILPEEEKERSFKKTYDLFCSYYDEHKRDFTRPYEGIIELLKRLSEAGVRTAVVTNKADEFAGKLVYDIFGNLIERTYGSVESIPKKPDPYLVNKAILDFGAEKKEVLYVGDSGVDMETALNAGLDSCGVLWGFRDKKELLENGAKDVVTDTDELLCKILN